MFFAWVMSVTIILGGSWIAWIKIIKPALKKAGVQVDDLEPKSKTRHQTARDEVSGNLKETRKDATAATDVYNMKREKSKLDEQIRKTDEKIEKIK